MKKHQIFLLFIFLFFSLSVTAQQYKIVTIVESIVPGGLGRSRIIETQKEADINSLTTLRDGNKSNQKDIERDEIKEGGEDLKETKLLNFYSLVGINFGNIAANDAIIAAKINEMVSKGWSVAFITGGVESDAGDRDGKGIFITRIFFVKK